MSFLPESVAAELERLILSVRPSEPAKLVSIVSKHLTQVVSIAFPRPNQASSGGGSSGGQGMHADPSSDTMMDDMTVGSGSGLSLPPGAESRARAAADLLCAVATCEGLEHGARDVTRAVLKLMHRDNVARLRVSAAAVARFSRVLLEAFTEDFEAVTGALDDALMEQNDAVSLWLSLVARHSAMGDLLIQLWGGALCPTSAATASPGMFCGPWIRHQAHSKVIDMLPGAIKNEEELPLFSFLTEVLAKGLNAQIGHFVDHILIGHCGEGFINAVVSAAEDCAAAPGGSGLSDSFAGQHTTPALPEALALLTSMLTMLQRSAHSQTSFRGDYHRSLRTNTAVNCFIKALPRLCSLLHSDALATRSGAFGSARLRIVDACMTLFRFNRHDSDEALFDIKFVELLFHLCESFPNHDVVLAALAEICTESIVRTCDGGRLEKYLVDECRLQQRLVSWVRDDRWHGTSLRALALTVAFGFAQRNTAGANDDDGSSSHAGEDGAASGAAALAAAAEAEERGGAGGDDDDDGALVSIKKPQQQQQQQQQPPHGSNDDAGDCSKPAAAPQGLSPDRGPMGAAGSEEWKQFVTADLPDIWKEWFTEITGFRFQDARSGGGRQVVHRPLVNLTKNGRGGRHAATAIARSGGVSTTVNSRGGSVQSSISSASSSNGAAASSSSSAGGTDRDGNDDDDDNEDDAEVDGQLRTLTADGGRRLQNTDPSSPPLELTDEQHQQHLDGGAGLAAFMAPVHSGKQRGARDGAAGRSGEPFDHHDGANGNDDDDDEEFTLDGGATEQQQQRPAPGPSRPPPRHHRSHSGNVELPVQEKRGGDDEEEEEFRLADIGAIDGQGGGRAEVREHDGEQDADSEWVDKFIEVHLSASAPVPAPGSSSGGSVDAAAASSEAAGTDAQDHADAAPAAPSSQNADEAAAAIDSSANAPDGSAAKKASAVSHDVDDDDW